MRKESHMGKKKLQQILMLTVAVLLILGLLKVMLPVIILGLIVYAIYKFLKGPNGPPYLVRVTTNDLYIYAEPTTNSTIVRRIDPSVYTIVEEADGDGATKWGRLKSGLGWINLDYVTRVEG